jgi:hypothetical protein
MATSNDPYLALLVEEYRTVVGLGNQASANSFSILQWGSAAVAVLVAAAFSQWRKHDAAVELVFLGAVPFLSCAIMLFWLGELARIRRLGDFLCVVELKSALLLGERRDALRHLGTGTPEDNWAEHRERLGDQLSLRFPVDIGADPMTWERWLKQLRNERGGATFGHLSWVYRLRLALYPAVAIGSVIVGGFYGFTGTTAARHFKENIALVSMSAVVVTLGVWLGVELALELDRASGGRQASNSGWARQTFKHLAGRALSISDWRRSPTLTTPASDGAATG